MELDMGYRELSLLEIERIEIEYDFDVILRKLDIY